MTAAMDSVFEKGIKTHYRRDMKEYRYFRCRSKKLCSVEDEDDSDSFSSVKRSKRGLLESRKEEKEDSSKRKGEDITEDCQRRDPLIHTVSLLTNFIQSTVRTTIRLTESKQSGTWLSQNMIWHSIYVAWWEYSPDLDILHYISE